MLRVVNNISARYQVGLRSVLCTLLATAIFLAWVAVQAGEVYKWVDEHGKTHFGDKPPAGQSSAESITIKSGAEAPHTAPSEAERLRRQRKLLDAFAQDRLDRKEAAAAEKQRKKELKARCARARHNLADMRDAGYLYDVDDEGQRVILSDQQRAETVRKMARQIAKNCR